jgi:hypothetical protein
VERFFAGGDTTVRGYDLDRLLTETVYCAECVSPSSTNRWAAICACTEHRPAVPHPAPLVRVGVSRQWRGGFLIRWTVSLGFRHGLGFAPFVFKLPIGDVSLAFAIPLNPKPGDSSWRFHLNVGLMF